MSQNPPANVELIVSQPTADGRPQFALPLEAGGIARVDVVDLDFVITTESGRQFLLPQAALWSATERNLVVVVQGQMLVGSDLARQVGPVQTSDLGGTRLSTVTQNDGETDRIAGREFGLGADGEAIQSQLQQSSQVLTELLQAVQASQNNAVQEATTNESQQTGLGRSNRIRTEESPLASPTPGAPPRPDNANEQTNPNPQPEGGGAENARVSFKLLAANMPDVTFQGAALGDTEVRQIFREPEVVLKMEPNAANLIFEAGKVNNQLLLEAVPTTNSLTLTVGAGEKVPGGLTIDGQALTAGSSITLSTVGMVDNQVLLDMRWDEGASARESNFQLSVFSQASDQRPLQVISFIGDPGGAYTLDLNGQPRLFVASEANNLVVEGNALANTITTGNGNDRIIGSDGADTINGGGGFNTVDYSQSAGSVTVDLFNGIGQGGFAAGDTYTNIQRVIGTTGNDTFVAKTAADQFVGGAGTDTVDYSNLAGGLTINIARDLNSIEAVIGSQGADQFLISRDVFTPERGSLVINGSSSVGNTLDYSTMNTAVSINMNAGNSTGLFGGHTFSNIQQVVGTRFSDTFYGGPNATHFNGGDDIDWVRYDTLGNPTGVTINLLSPGQNTGWAAGDTYANIDRFMGSNGADTLTADHAGRFLFALNGQDQLIGGNGNDVLDFNSGNSSLVNDRAIGGGGNDTIRINWGHISNPASHDHQTLINGGSGRDTLEIYGSGSINLTNLSSLNGGGAAYSNVNSIEVINLRGVSFSANQTVTVTKEVIQGLVDAGSPPKLEIIMGNRNVTFDFGADQEVNQFASGRVEFLSGNNVVAELQVTYV